MPKFKPAIREQEAHLTKDGTYYIKIRVTHNHKAFYTGTGYYVLPEQFADTGEVLDHPNAAHYNTRMMYNKAIDDDKADLSQYPFRRFKIKQAPSRDRDLEIEDILKIKDADLKFKGLIRARDLFMLSFYLFGINFKDMLYAQK
jgi:hypothetical protein